MTHTKPLIIVSLLSSLLLLVLPAQAEEKMPMAGHHGNHDNHHAMGGNMGHGQQAMSETRLPTLPGQDAFGAIQEIMAILEADPNTDWSRVSISALREHLVDMSQLILNSQVSETPINGGLAMEIRGSAGTIDSIQRMVPAHAAFINGKNGWNLEVKRLSQGARLTVTANSDDEAQHIRALGFFGIMATDAHHQAHHLGIARGENVHQH